MHTRTLAIAACAAVSALLSPTIAAAQEPALAAPGGPFRVFPAEAPSTITVNKYGDQVNVPPEASKGACSQGPIGTVRTPNGETHHVMLTAAHCFLAIGDGAGDPSAAPTGEVSVPVGESYQRIGQLTTLSPIPPEILNSANPLDPLRAVDWAVVSIDEGVPTSAVSDSRAKDGAKLGEPVVLTHIRDYPALAPGAFAFDNLGQPICKDGATNGRGCGTQVARTHDTIYSVNLGYDSGDSGGVNFDPRDGAILGVTSVHFGPIYKAQTADSIVESAYGVPDGQVNDHFTVDASTAPHAEFTTLNDENFRIGQAVQELNPNPSITDPDTELRKATDAAQQEATRLADDAARGQINPEEIQRAVEHHSGQIGYWGGEVAELRVDGLIGSTLDEILF
ncbi:hypothetical protein CGLAU_01275 [Corynebacterium glaucum]|uniref:Trypsin n=1 Tax=Corynebacterium glaucum TaxID=187491 RepID=A0A1Q2HTS2_9CORY|nr:hypothetical protein [Corynebacterium glaucum]AQQ14246.1 hypothetical protein CGLAU_01275 [Corynebacterium glaucum]WJZ06769.1 hypothetical protein CGLAUT_01295 [Corynebacterium glaucum]